MEGRMTSADRIDFGNSKRFLISGGTGFIGSALCRTLLQQGHVLTVLTRQGSKAAAHFGDQGGSKLRCISSCAELAASESFDVVVNLAGAPVVGPPWTEGRRKMLLDSRLGTTQQLLDYVQRCGQKPALWLQASAIGYYGSDSMQTCDESTPAGQGFAAELCRRWEEQTEVLAALGVRRVVLRFGLVFGRAGGSFPPLALPFRFGLGSVIGSGEQTFAWVHLDDVLGAMAWAVRHTELSGAFNVVGPEAVSYRGFARQLGRVLRRPVFLRVPQFVLRLLLGEMSLMLTHGPRIVPQRLQDAGYSFRFATLDAALHDLT
jgi:uncharacterized protein (TIGR01777 family)